MANKKLREKRRATRQRHTERDKIKSNELELESDEEDSILKDSDSQEDQDVVEKYYAEEDLVRQSANIPTSWKEMDALEEATIKADKVRRESWKVSDLVSNILYSEMPPEEKGKAIASVGSGYSERVKKITGRMEKSITDDELEVLQISSLLAKDARHTSTFERFTDFISKAKLTYAAEQKLSDADFAFVVERDGKKVRKYPIHDKAHVRNALARAAQQIEEGGEGASDAKAALPKIRSAAKKMGIGKMEKTAGAIMIEKDSSGSWRAVMWPTNNFKDTDGEILTKEAHEEYAGWVNEHMHLAPVFTTWHEAGLVRKHQVDFVDFTNGFMLMSAPLEPEEAAALMRVEKETDLGMSHGTIVLERDRNDPKQITKYRMVEVSDLPLENAANPFTDISVISKEADMDKKKYIASLLGDERAEEYYEASGLKQADLRAAGVEEKEKKPQEETPAPASETHQKQDAPAPLPDMEAIIKAVSEHLDVPGLNQFVAEAKDALEKVEVLENLVKSLSSNADEKLAEKISPPVTQKMAWTRPSTSKDNVVSEDDKLVKQKPQANWFAEAVGVEPLETSQ